MVVLTPAKMRKSTKEGIMAMVLVGKFGNSSVE